MSDRRIFEIRLWHGLSNRPFERWYATEEPAYLKSGAVTFTCIEGFQHYVFGNVQVSQRPNRRESDRPSTR